MWTKNGENVLPAVLQRIDKVIPEEFVNKKILVDDSSEDRTVEIAKEHGWTVYHNTQGGIAGGFNEAFAHVETELFLTFEQDVILNPNWFNDVLKHLDSEKVAVAQGIRVPSHDVLGEIYLDKLRCNPHKLHISLDNCVLRTKAIKEVGAFPSDVHFVSDTYLHKKLADAGYEWVTDRDIVSVHIRPGIRKELEHYSAASFRADLKQPLEYMDAKSLSSTFVDGVKRTLRIMFKRKLPKIFFVYPYMCIINFKLYIQLKTKTGSRPEWLS